MLELYTAPGTCAMASHIVLAEIGEPYAIRRVDFQNGQQRSPEYLAVNPRGRVPALVTERGVLFESPAVLAYLAQRYPAAGLAPLDDPFAFAQAQAFNSYVASTLHVAHAHRMRGTRWVDDPDALKAMQAKVPQTVGEAFQMIEDHMLAGPWVLGERYSICDAYLFTVQRWMKGDSVDPARYPKIAAHTASMQQRPAVIRALAEETA